jgi:UDP-N-acetylmuramate dehydrogenase
MNRQALADIAKQVAPERAWFDEPMFQHTTFKVGGPADLLVQPESLEEVVSIVRTARAGNVPLLTLGNGSNVLVLDGGIEGVVMDLSGALREVSVRGQEVVAQAGAPLKLVAKAAQQHGLTGLEFAHGIPGTVGGGALMNAGAYDGEMAQVLRWLRVLDRQGQTLCLDAPYLDMGYRHSRAMDEGWIILEAGFALVPGDPAAIQAKMDDLARRRREKQPLQYPSAGSFFKRPAGHYAGQLIQEAGMKGHTVGGAQVSTLHAGFVINLGGATAADILQLKDDVVEAVERRSGVHLEMEVRIVGREKGDLV